ncbi:MAG: histidine phosphotransferase family protein [Robiginitomaculum sp.]
MFAPIMKLTASDFAALLCARICHDLVSPIGALGAAIEVLDDDDNMDMREDAMELIKLSAGQASAKLQFLRLAFGAGGAAPGVLGVKELERLSMGVYGEGKTKLNWQFSVEGIDKPAARILLNLVMLALQSIPRGGKMSVSVDAVDNAAKMVFVCTGPKARLDKKTLMTLAGKAPEDGFDGRTIQPFYTGMITRDAKGSIDTKIEGETVTFTAIIPNF